MDVNFERMLAHAVRGNQAAGPPQEPTVPDKCVLPYNLILLLTRPPSGEVIHISSLALLKVRFCVHTIFRD
jgi:hypothetical protein